VTGKHGNNLIPRKVLATNAVLQDKLSWYMDIVEAHLVDSISRASGILFSTLDSIRELHLETVESVEWTKALRESLASLYNDVVTNRVNLLQKQQLHRNLQSMNEALIQMKGVMNGIACSESLINTGEVEKALVEINAVERMISGERDKEPRSELLQGVSSDLEILRSRIGNILESKIHDLLIEDLQRHIRSVPIQEVLFRWEAASLPAKWGQERSFYAVPAYMGMTDELRAALLPNIYALHRFGSPSAVVQAYGKAVLREVRDLLRRGLPSTTEEVGVTTLARASRDGRGGSDHENSSNII
jgi:vacuolar protein sorting-associated protein 54